MIKNIICDLSEVIISGYHGIETIIGEKTDIAAEDFLKRKKEVTDVFLDAMRGKYSEDEYLDYLLKGKDWKISKKELKEFIRQNLNVPVKGTMKIIEKLKDKYHLILLSDHVKEWMEYILENNTDIAIFDHQYFSYEYGKLKEDEGCFEYVLQDLRNISKRDDFY